MLPKKTILLIYGINPGYRATPANLLTVPVYAFACIVTCIVGYMADRYGHRGYFNMFVLYSTRLFKIC